ncbi:VOC family protein [uncultured Tateyamaria sp.]|uniref:VOC family protein n=1 Tax=uncultured Tateyamaria sp. TaxID=455651 RepID=UPI00261E05DF|nr:VOC family protein [uncultured Tateyamaria sp.]
MPHFEIHADDVSAAKTFYKGLFSWEFSAMPGGEDMDYVLIEGRDIGMDKGVTAGLMRRMDGPASSGGPIRGGTMTFAVADCDERYQWALANGGAEAMPPQDFPGIGRCAYVEDGQGNVVGMITPAEST